MHTSKWMTENLQALDIERRDVARLAAELDAHQVDADTRRTVFVRVAAVHELRHRRPSPACSATLNSNTYTSSSNRSAMSSRPRLVLSSTAMSSPSDAK